MNVRFSESEIRVRFNENDWKGILNSSELDLRFVLGGTGCFIFKVVIDKSGSICLEHVDDAYQLTINQAVIDTLTSAENQKQGFRCSLGAISEQSTQLVIQRDLF